MQLQLDGKRALVTGSSSGLGEETARVLAAEGASVVVHGRDEARTAAVAEAIRAAGGTAATAVGDLGTDAGADAVAAAALADGPIDILVNNVGTYDMSLDWSTATPEHWAALYNTNVLSGVRMIQRLVPGMRERGWGRVIQVSSVTGELPQTSQPHYAAANAARTNLAKSLARELRHTGVTSNAIVAGGILVPSVKKMLTDLGRRNGWGDTWDEIAANENTPFAANDVGRTGEPREYADLITFLASPLANYITGSALRIDGGW
ncbi:SDR family NAD(P)-dependent oxidoreductase [Streptomyces avicenniae]|uniref:SDR family NAD(P)-dependent oxidoreductase n=1 Tax=Streptomyces avicenniae TaxID=500153 RepID=UPI00069B8277|nr:SDR family NAD(P)-dependent oxidoreductase [Streptomyces avicenniae]